MTPVDPDKAAKILQTLAPLLSHEAVKALPHECCGLIVRTTHEWSGGYALCQLGNMAEHPEREFEFHPTVLLAHLYHWGKAVRALYHSHPVGPAALSGPDIRLMHKVGLDMVLLDKPSGCLMWYGREHQGPRAGAKEIARHELVAAVA